MFRGAMLPFNWEEKSSNGSDPSFVVFSRKPDPHALFKFDAKQQPMSNKFNLTFKSLSFACYGSFCCSPWCFWSREGQVFLKKKTIAAQ